MPIIQISEIQHRRGLKEDLPELAEGELALAVDTGEVFIGTPALPSVIRDLTSVTWLTSQNYKVGQFVIYDSKLYRCNTDHNSNMTFDPANWNEVTNSDFANPNTRILTEWSKNIENILKYSYLNRNNRINSEAEIKYGFQQVEDLYEDLPDVWPYQAIKQVGSNTYTEIGVRRYLQERLDERVSVLSYGATGNGREYLTGSSARYANDMDAEANAIRRATVDLANKAADNVSDGNINDTNKAVYFPAGTYVVNKQLFLTNRTRWIGDGIGKTRIVFNVEGLQLHEFNNSLLTTIGTSTAVGPDTYISVDDVIDDSKVEQYAYQFISNLVSDIHVSGISFEIVGVPAGTSFARGVDALRLIRASNVLFEDCSFSGTWDLSSSHNGPYDFTQDSAGVIIDSAGDTMVVGPNTKYCRNIKFQNCTFDKFYYGALLSDSMVGIYFDKCRFTRMYRGIMVGEDSSSTSSWATYPSDISELNAPSNVKIFNNIFKHIASHGAKIFKGYKGDGVNKSILYDDYEEDERLTGFIPFTQSYGNLFLANHWENVGNYDGGTLVATDAYLENPLVPVITFASGSTYNMCLGDTFARDIFVDDSNRATAARVWFDSNDPNVILNPQDEAFFRPPAPVVPPSATLVPTTGPESVSTPILLGPPISPAISHYSWIITYTIVYADWGSGPLRRRKFGTMRVSVDPIDRIVAYDNDETLNGGPDDITLSAIVNNDDAIELLVDFHNSLPTTTSAKIYYNIEPFYAPYTP